MGRFIGGTVVALVIFGIVFATRSGQKAERSEELLEAVRPIVQQCSVYAANRDYIDYLCEAAHEEAFENNYEMSLGRRSRFSFDPDGYFEEWFGIMIRRAEEDNSTHVADSLSELEQKFYDGELELPE